MCLGLISWFRQLMNFVEDSYVELGGFVIAEIGCAKGLSGDVIICGGVLWHDLSS